MPGVVQPPRGAGGEWEVVEAPAVGSARLAAVVFVAGGATLATEIAAARLLAPAFGSSTVVWANVIGLMLVYLSVGYWLGGRLADRSPSARTLALVIGGAAAPIALLPFVARPFLDLLVGLFDLTAFGVAAGSFVAALLLFSVPVTLLGVVTPFSIRLALDDVSRAGTVAGRLYAASATGSILGTFLSATLTLPLVGTQRTLLGAALLLVLAAALLPWRRPASALSSGLEAGT